MNRPWTNILQPELIHNRTIRGILENVDNVEGFVSMMFNGLPSGGRIASIPWLWASFPEPGKGAWGRYIPFKDDLVKIGFDIDDNIHILGYDAKAGFDNIADGKAGWHQIKVAQEEEVLPMFKQLKSGEFDFMSIGGAYIFGSQEGQLLLSAGTSYISLAQGRGFDNINIYSPQYKLDSRSSSIRFGQVKRSLSGSPGEVSGGLWNPDGSLDEFEIDLEKQIAGAGIPMARFAIGAVSTDVGPDLSFSGNPRRYIYEVKDELGTISTYSDEVDTLGNCTTISATASTNDITLPKADATLTTKTYKITNTETDIKSPNINLGLLPTGGSLNGTLLSQQIIILSALVTPIAAAPAGTLSGAMVAGVLNAMITALQAMVTSSTSSVVKIQ